MLDIAAIVIALISALFPSMRLQATVNGSRLHLQLVKPQKQSFQVHFGSSEPSFSLDAKTTTAGDIRTPEVTLSAVKITPETGAKPALPPTKLNLDRQFRPTEMKFEAPWLDLVSLMGGLPHTDLSAGKPYPYKCKIGAFPLEGNIVYKGMSGANLRLFATGTTKMSGKTFGVTHELLFPKSGGPVQEIHVKMTNPQSMTLQWTAKRS